MVWAFLQWQTCILKVWKNQVIGFYRLICGIQPTYHQKTSDGFRGWANILIPGIFSHVWEISVIKGIYTSCFILHPSEFPGRPRYPSPGVLKWIITEMWRSASCLGALVGAQGKIRAAKIYPSLLNTCHPLAEARKHVSKHLASVVYTVFPEISIKNMTDAEITPFSKSKASFKGGTRAGVTQRALHQAKQLHLTAQMLLQASLIWSVWAESPSVSSKHLFPRPWEFRWSHWIRIAHPDASQGCETHHAPMAGTGPLTAALLTDQRLKQDSAKVPRAGLRCKAKGFSSWHLSRSRRWRRHWIQPEQVSREPRSSNNTHYKLTIDFL